VFNYAHIAARCASAIDRAARDGVLRRLGERTGDEWDPVIAEPVDTNIRIFLYRPYKRNKDESNVVRTNWRALVKPEPELLIQTSDKVAFDVTTDDVYPETVFYEIVDVQEFNTGGIPLYWELEIRT
jgi:hypothetical protein